MTNRELVRVSDAERDAAVVQLREHLAEGRLSLEEFTERMTEAYGAGTTAELEAPLRDLPAPTREARRRRTRLLVRVVAFGLFVGFDLWRVPAAWAKRTFGEVTRGIRQGEHKELTS